MAQGLEAGTYHGFKNNWMASTSFVREVSEASGLPTAEKPMFLTMPLSGTRHHTKGGAMPLSPATYCTKCNSRYCTCRGQKVFEI